MSIEGTIAEKRGPYARWLVLALIALCCLLGWLLRSDLVPFLYAQLIRAGSADMQRWAVHRMSTSKLPGANRQCWNLLAESDDAGVMAALSIVEARADAELIEASGTEMEQLAALLDREPPLSDSTEMEVLRVLGELSRSRWFEDNGWPEAPSSVGRTLAKYLDHPDVRMRERAASYLAFPFTRGGVGAYLTRRLEHGRPEYRSAVLQRLWLDAHTVALYLDEPAIEALMATATDCAGSGQYEEVEWSLRLLGHAGGNEVLDFIAGFAENERPELRRAAALALDPMGNRRHVDLLMGLLQDEEPDVRRWAPMALAEIGDSAALPALVEIAEDADSEATIALALIVIGQLGDPAGEDVRIRHLTSPSERVVGGAVEGLALCGSTPATRSIAELLDDPRKAARDAACLTLSVLCPDGPSWDADAHEWSGWLSRQPAEGAGPAFSIPREIKILQRRGIGYDRVRRMRRLDLIPALRRWMDGPDRLERRLAAEALAAWGQKDALHFLITELGLDHQSEGTRLWALRALRRATGKNFFGNMQKWQEWYDAGCPGFPVLPPPRRLDESIEPLNGASPPKEGAASGPHGDVQGPGGRGGQATHE